MDFLKDFTVGSYQNLWVGSVHRHPGRVLYASLQSPKCTPKMLHVDELPEKKKGRIRIAAVSDTHARHDSIISLPESDIFVHTGDILMSSSLRSHGHGVRTLTHFNDWIADIPATYKVVIAGNHDFVIEQLGSDATQNLLHNCTYLENSSTELGDIRIWGSPLSHGKSWNRSFQSLEYAAYTKECLSNFEMPLDIILTHGPNRNLYNTIAAASKGSAVLSRTLHFWGHWHAGHGTHSRNDGVQSICACIMDGRYNLSNVPIILDCERVI